MFPDRIEILPPILRIDAISANFFLKNNVFKSNDTYRNWVVYLYGGNGDVRSNFFSKNQAMPLFLYRCLAKVTCNYFENNIGIGVGAIETYQTFNAIISNNHFKNNIGLSNILGHATGAVWIGSAGFAVTNNTITKNIFENNKSIGDYGGAIGIGWAENTTITNNVFIDNEASERGGAICFLGFDGGLGTEISNNTFIDNMCNDKGGAIYFYNYTDSNDLLFHSNVIYNHEATQMGGGIFIADNTGMLTITKNNIFDNETFSSLSNVYIEDSDQQILTNNYWGGETSNLTLMGIEYAGAAPDVAGARSEPWPLCVDEPNHPDCVGADFEYEE